MSVKDINKLGEAINLIKDRCDYDIILLLGNLPEKIDIIKSKKTGAELTYLNTHDYVINIYKKIILRKDRAWSEMIKLIEGFAIKEQKRRTKKK